MCHFLSRLCRMALPVAAFLTGWSGISASDGALPPPGWEALAVGKLREAEYRFGQLPLGGFSAPNRALSLRSTVTVERGLSLAPRSEVGEPWALDLTLNAIGREGSMVDPGISALRSTGNRVERVGRGLTEWIVNEPAGVEHGFTVADAPGDERRRSPLILELRISGSVVAQPARDGSAVSFLTDSGRAVVHYGSLVVRDASGEELSSAFEYSRDRLRIVVDDRGAEYPIVIDPLITVPDWLDTIDQSDARFGFSVTGAGDLNDDGFDDIIVGAERYDNGQSDEGAAFVYLGGPGGPDTNPIWYAEGNHAGARFGTSVAGIGDVNRDGFDDAVIGAPFWDDGMQTDEGGVFVYHGSLNALNPLLSRPVGNPSNADWHAEGNQNVALFGDFVAWAGDVNRDLADDIIVGAPLYNNDQQDEGSAFVYHGSNNVAGLGFPARPVGTPANANWKGESNQVISLYGDAVGTAGSVNGDIYDDVIVGAPDYQNNFFDEGRAFVYLGSATGVSTTASWFHDGGNDDASFGISVAGAGNVNGDGFDDVLVGAEDWTNGQVREGAAFLYYGKAGGLLGATAAWTFEVNQGGANVGSRVSSAGDVNGDFFDDILVAAEGFDGGQIDEGAVYLFMGSPSGLPSQPARSFEANQVGCDFGESIDAAGDLNGDGYPEILVGADLYSLPQSQEGGAFLYFGCRDDDRDGICHTPDNCPLIVNPAQEDVDSDGIGDVCDACEDVDDDDTCDKPRVLIQSSGPGEQVLVEYGSPNRFLVNTFTPYPGGLDWTQVAYDDLQWLSGLYGIGFENPPAGFPVGASDLLVTTEPPNPGSISVFTRSYFNIPAGTQVDTLFLGVDYDDAYVAWINGVEVFRSPEMPQQAPEWNTTPVTTHESSNGAVPNYTPLQDISASGISPLVIGGTNLLAIGVWNQSALSSDLVLVPRLSINRPVTSTMRYQANTVNPNDINGNWRLTSFDDAAWAQGNYGVGFESGTGADLLVNTDVPASSKSVYTRATFDAALSTIQSVYLGADYDDGYVAWINGHEVYRSPQISGAPGTIPAWDANATSHESSNGTTPNYGTLNDITFQAQPYLLNGQNLLAIAVWQSSPSSLDDLVLVPRLSINEGNTDNCLGLANPTQSDVDGDGAGDACDPDIDGDTLANASDNCPNIPNLGQANCDGGSQGDVCDPCPCDSANDGDNDGVCAGLGFNAPKIDDQDNCPLVFNPPVQGVQPDTNSDGEGDACDPDIDGDGDLNQNDNCVYIVNANQLNSDGDIRGFVCDCNDASNAVWEKPSTLDSLRLVRHDLCANFACTQSLTACGSNIDCVHDFCDSFNCTQSFGVCDTNADCEQDHCTNFTCSLGGNGCSTSVDCTFDFCANKSCTVGGNACTTDAACVADACSNKKCTEGAHLSCTSNATCTNSPTDICVGECLLGGNACVSNTACTLDRCQGECTGPGIVTCTSNAACTQDVCRGNCSVSTSTTCTNDTPCTAPQTDLCKGNCSLSSTQCVDDSPCTQTQTDLCKGTCALTDVVCTTDGSCVGASADTLRWKPPASLGATSVVYDTLRSLNKQNFTASTTCVETNGVDQRTTDATLPAVNNPLFYLIRTENNCPESNMGYTSGGAAHTGRTCP